MNYREYMRGNIIIAIIIIIIIIIMIITIFMCAFC